ncbi:MAG TPA: VIT family protein [Candidatus Polarisedimenticolia bacterium]|nr:VIT family protein [Candidatus Polarisedimenticolia bacterium]
MTARSPSASAPPANKERFVARYLDLGDRLGEILFGLIMVLSFTLGAGLVVHEGVDATKEMLIGIIGCNIAWGLIDGVMYILGSMFERGRSVHLLHTVQRARGDGEALEIISSELDPRLAAITSTAERERLYRDILKRLRTFHPLKTTLTKADVYGAIASFWLVVLSAIPAVVPFLIFQDRLFALRVSNGLLLAMLFYVGYRWGKETNSRPWLIGTCLLAVGIAMVGTAIALGG